jgi:hypothetical protein
MRAHSRNGPLCVERLDDRSSPNGATKARPRPALRGFEGLEARLAPAIVVAADGHSAAYADVDGDKVTVKVSLGTLTAGLFTSAISGAGEQLQEIDLSGGGFDGANLSFGVTKVPGGDGLANVGYVNSTGHDLGKVAVKGDLGRIDAGDAVTATPGLKSLSVRSLGRLGTDTQAAGGSLESDINGALGSLAVAADVNGAFVQVTGGADGKIGAVTIGGSLIGGSVGNSGQIIGYGDMGPVKIGHDVQGGSNFNSGVIGTAGKLASVSIGGSLIGGSNDNSGVILSVGDMGPVKIGRDLTGGSISFNGPVSLQGSGLILSTGRIAGVTIGGSIITGIDAGDGALTLNASIRAHNDIGSLVVKGSLVGHGDTGSGASPVVISARGRAVQGATIDLAIGKISIGGRVEFANILAGYDIGANGTDLTPVNGDAQIGSVSVGGDWSASNLVAGAMNAASGNANFGDGNDASIGAGSGRIVAGIASITIKGQVFGTPDSFSATDHYGFVSQQIGALKVGGNTIRLAADAHNDDLSVGGTFDLTVHEV